MLVDVAIIGAGLAGLTCARVLDAAGYSTVILEKSRGAGGRVATRHARDTRIDHGLPFFWDQGPLTQKLIAAAIADDRLRPWPRDRATYCSPTGNSEIGKYLAGPLDVRLQHHVEAIHLKDDDAGNRTWQLTCIDRTDVFRARAIAIAIPAAQAAELLATANLNPTPTEVLAKLNSVIYDPCITVMAGYAPDTPLPNWRALDFEGHALLQWIGLDSSKRDRPTQPIFVIHSSPEFAKRHLNAAKDELDGVARKLLSLASTAVPFHFGQCEWFQIHRWRFAIPQRFLHDRCLQVLAPLPLVCGGDWCAGINTEAAIASGQAMAAALAIAPRNR